MKGKLEDFNPGELIQTLGLLGKSGSLQLERAGKEGRIVFRGGRIIFVASSSLRENLGSLLLARKLISEDELMEALERQESGTETRRLGSVLVDMEAISQEQLEEVVREQFSRIVSGFIHWDSGSFEFEARELADHGEVEVDGKEFLVGSGMESTHVLLDAARQADEQEALAEDEPDYLDSLIDQVTSPTIGGETAYRLLDLLSEACGRCVLFAAYALKFRVVGHFGLDTGDGTAGKRVSQLEVARDEPSILARAFDREHSIFRKLEAVDGDAAILEALGGASATKSVALPVRVGDSVIMVLYGDDLSEDLSTGWIEQLEIAVQESVRQHFASSEMPTAIS